MKTRPIATLFPLIALFALLAGAAPAMALGRAGYTMEVLVDGRPLTEQQARDRTYIEALRGREYSIRVTNHTGSRIAVALSVDGLNTIDARTTSPRDARKWILDPYDTIVLDGWQLSNHDARRFFFTTEDQSYGAWLGRTKNLGLISAAVFRERRARYETPEITGSVDSRERGAAAGPSARSEAERKAAPQAAEDFAATGIGRRLDHDVRRVHFDAEVNPAAVLELRYEYHDALVKLGVLPPPDAGRDDALARRERARGFRGGYCPDPFERGAF
jgi:hypothetical protein